jgi:hypothetical protein
MTEEQLELNFSDDNQKELKKMWERIDANLNNLVCVLYELLAEFRKRKNS